MTGIVENQPAYILHRRPYRESSYLLDVFTLDYGRLTLVAKGATRGKRNQSGLLQVFQPLLIDWSGRASLKNLLGAEASARPFNLVSRFLYCGYYLNELILKLCPEMETNRELFICYADTLSKLHESANIEAALRHFECHMLGLLGLAPDFSCNESGNAIDTDRHYGLNGDGCFVVLDEAVVEQDRFDSGQSDESQQMIGRFSGATLQCLANKGFEQYRNSASQLGEPSDQQNLFRESKQLMRHLIDSALQGRTLKSRELFKHMKRQS